MLDQKWNIDAAFAQWTAIREAATRRRNEAAEAMAMAASAVA